MIVVKNLSIQVGSFSLKDINFELPKGCYCMLMGKTGTGKTTLLEVIAGLKYATSGQITFYGRDVTRLRPSERGIGYVPQDGALFPTMTVRNNLAFALKVRKAGSQVIDRRVDELAELLSIKDLLSRMPLGLSGGERQRVALGRALAFQPEILLLDEPLSALDDETRGQMWDVLRRVRDHTGVTAFHVTHNREDARQLADLLFMIENGQLRKTITTSDSTSHDASTNSPEPQEETTP